MDKSEGGSFKDQENNDHNDSMEHNPNVQFGVNNQRNRAHQIGNTGSSSREFTTSYQRHLLGHGTQPVLNSSHGTMGNQWNVLGQSIDGTRPVMNVNSMSSSLGTGQGIDGTRPVVIVNSMSSLGIMSNQRNVLGQGRTQPGLNLASSSLGTGQGIDGSRPVVNSESSSLGRGQGIDGSRPVVNVASSSLGTGQCIDGTRPVVNSASSSLGRGQCVDGTRPVVNSASSSLRRGHGIDGSRPVVNLASSSLGRGQGIDVSRPVVNSASSRLGRGQGIDGTRPVVNLESTSLGTRVNPIIVSGQGDNRTQRMSRVNEIARVLGSASPSVRAAVRQRWSSSGVNQVTVSSTQGDNSHTTRPNNNNNQILDPVQLLDYLTSSWPFPPYVPHQPYMYAITRAPPADMMVPPRVDMPPPIVLMAPPTDSIRTSVVRMVPPMVQMHPSGVRMGPPMVDMGPPVVQMVPPMVNMGPPVVQMVPPMVQMRPRVVQMVPPMVEMRPPMVQEESRRGFVHGPASPSTNINMGVRPDGEIQQGSYSDEAMSRHRRSQDDEPESSSRDCKRIKR